MEYNKKALNRILAQRLKDVRRNREVSNEIIVSFKSKKVRFFQTVFHFYIDVRIYAIICGDNHKQR